MDQGIEGQIAKLESKLSGAQLPEDLKEKVNGMVGRLKYLKSEAGFVTEFDNTTKYIDWIISFPWGKSSKDILDLTHAKQVLDKHHYGLDEVKNAILEYLSTLIMRSQRAQLPASNLSISHAPIISLVGLVGTGKTTISFSIAEALGRKIVRIPFGGMGGAALLRGQSRAYPDAEPGYIAKALRSAGTNNPVILLDEIDRVSDYARGDIMGVLVELLDPEQNKSFVDHFVDYPFDLSNVLFIATSNNTKDISTAVLDRLEIIQMPSYSDEEKHIIAKSYMFPRILDEAGLTERDIIVDDQIWELLIRPLGYDPGIRSLQRTIQGLVRKVTRAIVEGKVPGGQAYKIDANNLKDLVPQW